MKIGIVLMSNRTSGGGLQHEISILENLKLYASESGHSFYVFNYEFPFDLIEYNCKHINIIKVNKMPLVIRLILYNIRLVNKLFNKEIYKYDPLLKEINKHDLDLMYYPGPWNYCINVDLPYVLTVWDLQHRLQPEFPEVSSNGIWKNREIYYQEAIKKAYAIIVDEEAGKEDVISYYNIKNDRVYVLPFIPPNINKTSKASNKILLDKYDIKSNFIFYPAQFWPHKNHVAILNAIKKIKEKYNIIINAVFVGSDKGNMEYIKKLTLDYGLTKQITFTGFVPDEEIPLFYKNALALVMPTYFGPSNIPVYEAFAYQCPVITSDIRGIKEQVKDAGLLINPSDYDALSDAIMKIYSNYKLREILINRGILKLKTWSGKEYIDNLIKIFDNINNKRKCWENTFKLK